MGDGDDVKPTNQLLSFGELRRWVAVLDKARREYRTDGNAARRFFENDLEDLLIAIGQFLPKEERVSPDAVLPSDPDWLTAEIARLYGDGDCGGAPQPA